MSALLTLALLPMAIHLEQAPATPLEMLIEPLGPAALTGTATYPAVKAHHILSSDKKTVSSLVSFSARNPRWSHAVGAGQYPNLWKATGHTLSRVTVGECTYSISAVISGIEIGLTLSGSDTLPKTACASLTDQVAGSGISAVFMNAPYPNGGTATVTLDLTARR